MYSSIARRLLFPIVDIVIRTNVTNYMSLISHFNTLNPSELQTWQLQKLKNLINHAYSNTDYYKETFDNNNIKPTDISSLSDLLNLPILTKANIRNNYNKIIAANLDTIPHIRSATGGSSGDPLVYLLDKQSWSFSTANQINNWERIGYCFGDKYIALGSTSLFIDKKPSFKHYLYYKLKNKIGLNGINMSDEICSSYLHLLLNQKIKYIYGYASSIYVLARFALQKNYRLKLKACMPTSEILTEEYRKVISQAFNCEILNTYGANDGGITAFEHQPNVFEIGYNTFVRFEKTKSPGQYKLLLTDLLNFAMPLINYELGDEVLLERNQDSQKIKFNGQTFSQVLGRISDMIELENGSVITGPGFTILFKDLPVEYYRIEKTGPLSVTCWVKKLPSYNLEHEENIISTFRKQLGSGADFTLIHSENVEFSKSGKREYFKS